MTSYPQRQTAREGGLDGDHEGQDVGEALEPLERVDEGADLPSGVPARLEPQLAPSGLGGHLVLGQQLWTRQKHADLPMGQNVLSGLSFLVAIQSAYTHRLGRLASFGGLAL